MCRRHPRRNLQALLAGGLAALVLCPGCAPPPSPGAQVVLLDLVEDLPLAFQRPPGSREGSIASVDPQSGALYLPLGARVHFGLLAPPTGQLRVDRVRRRGDGEGRLDVALLPRRGEPAPLLSTAEPRGPTRTGWELSDWSIARLVVHATGSGEGGFLLAAPRLAAALPAPGGPTPPPGIAGGAGRGRPVVLYLVDSLRADRLGCYGGSGGLTPAIDAFARQGVLFERAIAQSSWTKSSVGSLFTGLWPGAHRAIGRQDRLPDAALTLAEILGAAGYRTAAFSTNPSIAPAFGFQQGFDEFRLLGHETADDELVREVGEWLRRRRPGEAFFLYAHSIGPHDPYLPPEDLFRGHAADASREWAAATDELLNAFNSGRRLPQPGVRQRLEALYAGEVAAADRAFGRLVQVLESERLLGDATVMFLSDHGEEFGEHGSWRHGVRLNRESVHIPLILQGPGLPEGRRIARPVQHVDLLPTLLDRLGLEAPPGLEGRSILPTLKEHSPTEDRPVFLHVGFSWPVRLGVRHRGWKLQVEQAEGRFVQPELYHLATDPFEVNNLAREEPIVRDYLATLLRHRLRLDEEGLAPETAVVDPETDRALRALGYLD